MPLVKPKLVDIIDLQDLKSYWKKGKKFLHAKGKRILQMHEAKKQLDKVDLNIRNKYSL